MKRMIVLRPEPGASASLAAARELGVEAEAIPLFVVEPVEWDPVDARRYVGIVATSANAFRHGGEALDMLRALPVHAVGEATAEAARAAGFTVASVGEGNREALRLPPGRLLHLAGRDHLPIEGDVTAVVVYNSRAIEPPPPLTGAGGAVVAVHSPRAGRRLAEIAAERSRTAIAAISANAARACGDGWERIEIAERPSEEALLALAAELCQTMPRP